LNIRLTEHKRATRNDDINNYIAEHHLKTNHRIDWDSAECYNFTVHAKGCPASLAVGQYLKGVAEQAPLVNINITKTSKRPLSVRSFGVFNIQPFLFLFF